MVNVQAGYNSGTLEADIALANVNSDQLFSTLSELNLISLGVPPA